jgi:NADPH-dependent 2,4-dienoyl-CoA reductase/sulfur reductase-like enzyme
MVKSVYVIIGGVAAGMSAASKIRSLDREAPVMVFERGGFVSFAACGMPYLIEGKVPSSSELVVYDSRFFKEKRDIDVLVQQEVTKIDPASKTVSTRNVTTGEERQYHYAKLLIATGARAVLPPIKNSGLNGIFTLRALEDGIAIQSFINTAAPQRALIIGAGNIGMELAEAFTERGIRVTLVEKMPNILGSMDDEIDAVVEEELRNNRVTLIKSQAVTEFIGENSRVKAAVLEGGETIETDVALIGAGIKPNSEVAREAGLELGQAGAIRVNERMETSIPDIYAAGDCAEVHHLVYHRNVYMPLGTTANKQGRVAGENMAGRISRFPGVVGTAIFKVFNLEVGRTGLTERDARREGLEYVTNVIEHNSRAHYYPGGSKIRVKLIAAKKSGQLLGAQMVGKEGVAKRLDVFATGLTTGMTVEEFSNLDLGYAPPFAPVYDPILVASSELLKKLKTDH